jgi:CO/xanthine dehydrogenase Mo-binding subunit
MEMVNDVRLPGMLHARMIRPAVAGAVPVSVEEESIRHIPGAKAVRIKDMLAVVAEKEWNAVKAAANLKVSWSEFKPNFPGHDKLHEHIRNAPVLKRVTQRENGSVDEGLSRTGPACAVADVRHAGATVWTSTQKPYDSAACVAELLGLPRDKVRAIWMFGTRSYGRNGQGDATADAAVLSQHLGRPIRVLYMRHEGIAWDPKGTAAVNRGRGGLDASGKVVAYE